MMMRTFHLALWIAAAVLVSQPMVSAQGGGTTVGGSAGEVGGGKGEPPIYEGPEDLSVPQPPEKTELEGETLPGRTIAPPQPTPQVPRIGLVGQSPRPRRGVFLRDTTEWLLWWRFQRWLRFEPPERAEPGRPITPRENDTVAVPASAKKTALAPTADQVLPALLALWEQAPQEADLRASLLLAISRVGQGPEITDLLRAGLRDTDERVIEMAALGLGVLREPHGIPILTGLVQDDVHGRRALARHEVPYRTRAFAAFGLGLVAQDLRYAPVRKTISEALLNGLLLGGSAHDDVGAACAQALGLFPGADANELVPELMIVLRNRRYPEKVRAQAPMAVAKLLAQARASGLTRSVYQELHKRLLDRNEKLMVRQGCALALGRLGTLPKMAEPAAESLIKALDMAGHPTVPHLAAIGLAEISASGSAQAQTMALPALLKGLEQGTDIDRSWYALALAWAAGLAWDQNRALPAAVTQQAMAHYPKGNSPRLKAALSLAMGMLQNHAAEEQLVAGMESIGEPSYRAEAVAGLALLGGRSLQEIVIPALNDLDPLREPFQVVCASLAYHDPQALVDTLGPEIHRSSTTYQARVAAADGLGWVREPAAIEFLLALIAPDNPYFVRAAAVESLGRLAERPDGRWIEGYMDLFNPYAATDTAVGRPERPGLADHF